MKTGWTLQLVDDGRPRHDQIIDSLRQGVASGRLAPGERLPTQRDLARAIGVSLGTVTRAYTEARRLGLLDSHVGRGTVVADSPGSFPSTDGGSPIDLTMNLHPLGPSAERLAELLGQLRRRPDIRDYAMFAPHAGIDWHRQAAAAWLAKAARFDGVDWRKLIICNGAQHAMALAFDALCKPGDMIFTEAVTFHGMKALAEVRGYRLKGLPIDREGLLPGPLDKAAAESGGGVLYVQPTLQNPTARTMSQARREEIARIAQRRQLWIVEGDTYGPLAWSVTDRHEAKDQKPIAATVPDRTFYVGSISKVLAPGLRVGFLVAPDCGSFDRLCTLMRATCYSVSTLAALAAAQWIQDGIASDILAEVAREVQSRRVLAQSILGADLEQPSRPVSLHAWLPSTPLGAERVAGQLLRLGVAVSAPSNFVVGEEECAGLRLCLCATPHVATLEHALRIIASVVAVDATEPIQSVV